MKHHIGTFYQSDDHDNHVDDENHDDDYATEDDDEYATDDYGNHDNDFAKVDDGDSNAMMRSASDQYMAVPSISFDRILR